MTYPYQDPTLDIAQRVEDLLSRLPIEDKAGLLFQPLGGVGPLDDPGMFGMPSVNSLLDRRINHFNILWASSAREIAAWHNSVQEAALARPLGIPVSVSTDPRHSFTNNPATALMSGPFSQWPEPLGFAALGSAELVERWADIVRREYLAVGIRVALHPQIDLTTEPRWARQSTTFGEDADLTIKLALAYIRGLQNGTEVGADSVSVMAKHFPGGGAQKDGEDPHFAYGREQVYPGGRFDYHLAPFKAVIEAGVSQMMPYYGMPVGLDGVEEVGFGFNKDIITGLLREKLGYDGIVCSDWGILTNTFWGVEELSYEERMLKALDAGIDQFGGEFRPQVLLDLVRAGRVTEARIDTSARRLLREKFRLGLFDNPLVDTEAADAIVGSPEARSEGLSTQAAAHVLLTNPAEQLPLPAGPIRLYTEGLSPEAVGDRAVLVDTPGEADVAVLRMVAPWEQRGQEREIESFFHAGSLAFSAEEIARVRAICAAVPTVLDVYLDRPAILTPFADTAAALTANFGASDEAFVQVLFGETAPEGKLPFDLPSSMTAVEESHPDVPFNTADPLFRFGHGLRYKN